MFSFKSFLVATLAATLVVAQDTNINPIRACTCSRGFINVTIDTQVAADPIANEFLNATALRPLKAEWPIFAEFCQPVGGIESKGVQFLLHGQTYTHQYWNPLFAGFENYSYVEYACSRGISSLAYDNAGAGLSFRPVSASDVQMPSAAQLFSKLGAMVKSGIAALQLTGQSKPFSKMACMCHSVGCNVINYELIIDGDNSPCDGVILTGDRHDSAFINVPFPIALTIPANQVSPEWANLDPGYVVTANITDRKFFYSPNKEDYDIRLFTIDEATKTPGPSFISKQIKNTYQSTSYSRPVAIIVGALDRTHCLNNNNQPCTVPILENSEPQFFPKVKELSLDRHDNIKKNRTKNEKVSTNHVSSISESNASPELAQNALSSASSLVLLQFFSRLFTFALNQTLVRLSTPRAFGTAAIQFELLLSTILFLCREGVRGALLRSNLSKTDGDEKDSRGKVQGFDSTLMTNISHLPLLIGTPFAVCITILYTNLASRHTVEQPYFRQAVALYTLSSVIELAAEPLYIRAQNDLRVKVRVSAEGAGIFCKAVVPVSVLLLARLLEGTGNAERFALLAFAFGQLGYAIAVCAVYINAYNARAILNGIKIKKVVQSNGSIAYFKADLLRLSAEMTMQSVLKHILTEGDRFLVSYLSPLADQGGYALAANYGSLVARIIFQPIEETARVFFSKSMANLSLSHATKSLEGLKSSIQTLLSLLLLMTHFTLLLITFLPPYLPLLATLFLPNRYHATNAPSILMVYTFYLPTMAFNGVLEAFLFSAASPRDLRIQSTWFFVFSAGFILVAVGFARGLKMGDVGLVWANVVNLGMRAVYAVLFVERFSSRFGNQSTNVEWRRSLPSIGVFCSFIAAGIIIRWSERNLASGIGGYSHSYVYALSGRKLIDAALPHFYFGTTYNQRNYWNDSTKTDYAMRNFERLLASFWEKHLFLGPLSSHCLFYGVNNVPKV
ncbi:hypothetical protein Clacol_003567 [Clathrus columnatus]|uniref:Man(5)GlcNAc(2)-PP-dolichol translocation protein RFT1 n=1 Tax=Clathrus columnatus TaxID=1419009 RepID=A0AAV5A4X8_9AGAM|nr:hypothetical protein Clacol_003567 [Clathrus columnatus]